MQSVKRNWTVETTASITSTSGKGWVENVKALHDLIESFTTDSERPVIKRLEFHIKMFNTTSNVPFGFVPVVVQAAGNFSSQVNLTNGNSFGENLNTCCDDVFGYQKIGEPSVGRITNFLASTFEKHYFVNRKIVIPQNIINLLNKEINSERLQTLYLGLCGWIENTSASLQLEVTSYCEWIEKSKGITIR